MAEVFRKDGFIVVVWPDDHHPPHVHVFKAGAQVKIAIGRPGLELPRILDDKTMTRQDRKEALKLVIQHQAICLAKWETLHG